MVVIGILGEKVYVLDFLNQQKFKDKFEFLVFGLLEFNYSYWYLFI